MDDENRPSDEFPQSITFNENPPDEESPHSNVVNRNPPVEEYPQSNVIDGNTPAVESLQSNVGNGSTSADKSTQPNRANGRIPAAPRIRRRRVFQMWCAVRNLPIWRNLLDHFNAEVSERGDDRFEGAAEWSTCLWWTAYREKIASEMFPCID